MNPEAIQDQVEEQLFQFLKGKDFSIISRAVSHWRTVESFGEIVLKVDIVGQHLPLKFKIIVENIVEEEK